MSDARWRKHFRAWRSCGDGADCHSLVGELLRADMLCELPQNVQVFRIASRLDSARTEQELCRRIRQERIHSRDVLLNIWVESSGGHYCFACPSADESIRHTGLTTQAQVTSALALFSDLRCTVQRLDDYEGLARIEISACSAHEPNLTKLYQSIIDRDYGLSSSMILRSLID